ncbi:MAG TPA: selenocysteine-specific translation elongation factor [Bryobacteraceae bacterium]|nr:selenocysteine-specific translation elongation factor [Bryobacteraceae bacterium]
MRIIAGTAGHIDHGKTSLVRALTGVDTDRLEEEKRRGISIDLGFAHLDLTPDLRVGFVDVPGHERFVKNMLAGASGIDLVILVIAADESIKPQTREHFEICRLLGIRHGVVALTKSDLVDPELVGLVRLELEEFIAGSFLEGAPVIPVSATTGAGLADLRAALVGVAGKIAAKDATQYARLPVDRSFSMRGHGAVVTGTLVSGSLALQDEVELYPSGTRARIRGLQVHGTPVERANAGERTAVNLAGIDSADVSRGMTLAPPGLFQATKQVDCAFNLLASAHPLKHRAPVHFHAGTAEVDAQARLIDSLDPVRPGTRANVRFLLREPLLMLPGDRFIVRMFSPVVTIGGGIVLDIAAPRRSRRTALAARLRALDGATAAERIALLVQESTHGMSVAELVARTGFLSAEIRKIAEAGEFLYLPEPQAWLASQEWSGKVIADLRAALAAFHRANPLQPGLSKEELRSRHLGDAPPFLLDALLVRTKDLVAEGDLVRLASHRLALKQDEEAAVAKIEVLFLEGGLAVPATSEVLAKSGVEAARARSLLQILLRARKLIRVGEDLVYHTSAIEGLRALLASKKGTRFAVPDFKEWTGVSRKYAIPLLEFLDRERVTRREGDSRVVL